MKKYYNNNGFTLIELSLVLVIIGLIVGGVLVGSHLIQAASIRAQIKQLQMYEVAFNTFKNKYNGIPGDHAGINAFLAGTINGNGNGFTELLNNASYDDFASRWSTSTETWQFFIQLSAAGMLPGQFDGSSTIGRGLPQLQLNNKATFFAGSAVHFVGSRNPDISAYQKGTNLLWMIVCGSNGVVLNDSIQLWDDDCGIFDPITLYSADNKMDDGRPLSGKFIGFGGYNSNNNCLSGQTYDMGRTSKECQAVYMLN